MRDYIIWSFGIEVPITEFQMLCKLRKFLANPKIHLNNNHLFASCTCMHVVFDAVALSDSGMVDTLICGPGLMALRKFVTKPLFCLIFKNNLPRDYQTAQNQIFTENANDQTSCPAIQLFIWSISNSDGNCLLTSCYFKPCDM